GGTATDTNPWHLYTVEGVYPVTLTVTDIGGATDTYNVSITAGTPGLLASFIGSPTSGSANLSVVFSDTSTGGPTNWTWAFGDGGTSTVQSPNYTYTLAGNYPVSLTVTNGTLSNTTIRQGFITVNPFADFTWYPGSGSSPLTVQFNDASLGQPSQWFWEFGDGTGVTSDQQDPVHVFPTLGTYSVRLTATGGGQTNVTTRVLELNESGPFAEFIANPRDGTYPLTVEFTDLSTGNPNIWEWNFGGNETSSDTNPVHIFEEPGTYTVTLTVRNAGGWSSVTKSGYITVRNTPAPSADFTASPRTGYAPLDVEFIDMSTGVVEGAFYEWDFGDQSPVSYDRNPSHTYTTNGTFTVKLNVTNPGLPPVGCELEQTDFIAVANEPVPTARFSSDTSIGNFPLTVAFTDESSGEITSWLWTFGDGASSSEQNPSHTYATPGVYTAYLRVTDSHGRGTQATKTITVRPIASFYLEPLAGEVPLTVQFTDTSTGAPSEWLWTFGDGATSTGSDPTHTYETPGIYDITLIVTSNGAASTPAHDDIEVGSVSFNANIVASPLEGYVPLEVAFQGEATGSPTTWLWEFGDGTYSRNPQVNHTFATTGRKTVTLTVTNQSGEVATATETITVRPKADFIVTPVIGKSPTTFYMTDQSVGEIVSYFWDFCNGSNSTEKNPSITFSEASMHWVTLTVTTSDGLSDSLRKDYWVTPNASFEWYPSSESDPLTVQFIDRSAGGALFSFWDFGDGTNSTTYDIPYLLLGDEAYSNPVHVYRTLGSYQVVLTKFGFDGLSDNSTMTVTLSGTGPTADFTASPRSGGFPLEVSFIDQSTGAPTSWQWDFGDGSDFSLERNPEHTYLVPGNFNVTLTASNENGADTNEKTDYIAVSNVPPPEADFTASPRAGVKPLSVNFIDQTTGSPVAWEWDFGDGSDTSFDRNPTHDYPDPGNYTVSLKATNAEGQSGIEEKFQFITVTAVPKPVAKFTASPTTAVPPFDVYFTDQSAGNPTSWKWTFGDGSEYGGPSSLQSPRHRYYKPGYYTVTLEVSNAQGYDQTYEIDYIYARNYPPQAAFEVNPRRGAAPLVVQFSDRSTGEGIKSWNWTFGDGVSSNLQNPVYVYNTPGTYSVSLMVESDGGTSYKNEPDLITVEPPLQANNITLYGGTWNFVSTPRKLAAGHNTAGVVFAGVDTASHTILTFDAATQAWVQYKADTEVKPLDGIWIYSAGPNTVTLVFDDSTIPQPPSKQVYVGWNTVGFGGVNQASARDWLTVYSALGEKWTSALGYHNGALPDDPIIRGSTDPRYSDSRPMYPTRGYWLSMAEPGVLQGMA
ncbi:MAG: PKD domain-containing protein, partial [Methanomicrobiales archaeon]|nr:PKD domain-containing protein [Methanomicrobiales archaeon]